MTVSLISNKLLFVRCVRKIAKNQLLASSCLSVDPSLPLRVLLSVRLSVHMEQLGSHWTNSCEIRFLVIFRKYRVIRNDCQGFNSLSYTIPRSPDATTCDFVLWDYVKDQVYVPPLPSSIPELLKVRIRTAIETITTDMLHTVWNELEYRVDVCIITKGAHVEHL